MGYGAISSWLGSRHLSDVATDALLRQCLSEFAQVSLGVTGGCMEPELPAGERVSIAPRAPRMGDVVLARHSGGLVLHRLVWGPPLPVRRWRTKADNSRLFDGWIRPENVLGVVLHQQRRRDRGLVALRSLAVGLFTRLRQRFSR